MQRRANEAPSTCGPRAERGSNATDRIAVCICTYRRPHLLQPLLHALAQQTVPPSFSFHVVVVDNDCEKSAESIVRTFADTAGVHVYYACECERNISIARNTAIRLAQGNLIALIDDDERPARDWLLQLYRTLQRSDADGVLGPVLPELSPAAPNWLSKGQFFNRARHTSGTLITQSDARSGNALLRRSLFPGSGQWFDPAFGRTGGEDSDFFSRGFADGKRFVWCDEAVVYETVEPDRWTALFLVRRALTSGSLDGEAARRSRVRAIPILVGNLLVLGVAAPLSLASVGLPKHLRVRVLRKLAYSAAVVAAFFGAPVLRYRD